MEKVFLSLIELVVIDLTMIAYTYYTSRTQQVKDPLQECAWNVPLKADSLRSTMLRYDSLL